MILGTRDLSIMSDQSDNCKKNILFHTSQTSIVGFLFIFVACRDTNECSGMNETSLTFALYFMEEIP